MIHAVEQLQQAFAGRYVVERELGRGGMATVYLARDERHRRSVAIKVIRTEYAAGVAAERFRGEIEIAAALAHPGIVPVFDSGAADDLLYYVMPYIEGESLRSLLLRQPRLGLEQTLRIARDVGDALAYAHSRGIVHRDVKPENILLVESRAVVADFGIARALAKATGAERLTLAGTSLGTPLYMSPEQASGEPEVDGRSDLYSLAAVVYEMLAGAAPHQADTPREIVVRKLTPTAEVPPLERPDVPASMDTAIRRGLAFDAAKRFATTGEFLDALSGGWSTPATQPTTQISRVDAAIRRFGKRRSLAAMAVLVAVAGVLVWRRVFPPLASSDGRVAIAVLPFRPTVASANEWAEAVPDLLTAALDGTPGLRIVDPWALWRTLRATPTSAPRVPDPAEGARLAERAGAACYLLGSITNLQGRLEITVRVYRRGRSDPWQTLSVAGPSDSVAAVVQRLAIDLIHRVSSISPVKAMAAFDRGLTRSPDALKAWLNAREFRRRGRLDSADVLIQAAISLDTTFAFAMVDALQIRSWLQFTRGQMYSDLMALGERAVRMSDSLPERQRLRARGTLASLRTDGVQAADAAERLIAIDSSDVEAWGLLSYANREYGWQFGRGEREAREAARQALRRDSTDVTFLSSMSWLTVAANDSAGLVDLIARLRHVDTTSAMVRGNILALEAAIATDAQFAQIPERLRDASIVEWISVYRMVRAFRPDRAEMIARRMFDASAMALQRTGLGMMVQLLAAQGRWAVVDSLRRAGTFKSAADFERVVDRLTVAASIAGVADEAMAQRAATALAASMPPESARALFQTRMVWLEGWLIGAWNAMYGDTVLASRWDAAIGTLPKGGSPAEYVASLQADIRSRLAARRGDRQTALQLAGRALTLWTIHTGNTSEVFPEPAMRFQLATLLRASGGTDSALVLFRSLVPPATYQGFLTARSSLEVAELADARGDHAYADREFLIALRLWERGDSIVAPLRERARRGLAHDRR